LQEGNVVDRVKLNNHIPNFSSRKLLILMLFDSINCCFWSLYEIYYDNVLYNTIQSEAEPVPGQPGCFQLTGKHIFREGMDPHDLLKGLADQEALVTGVKLLGVTDRDEEIEYRDPRFNDLDEPDFGVARNDDGYTLPRLQPPGVRLLPLVLANVAGPEHDTDDEAIENFRKEA
jgi:hypothetical protein